MKIAFRKKYILELSFWKDLVFFNIFGLYRCLDIKSAARNGKCGIVDFGENIKFKIAIDPLKLFYRRLLLEI